MNAWEIALLVFVCLAFAFALGITLYNKLKGKSGCCDCGTKKRDGKSECSGCAFCKMCGEHKPDRSETKQ